MNRPMESTFSARISDLARAWVGWGTLDPRPYVPHNGPAEVAHDVRRIQIATHPLAINLLATMGKFFSRFTSNILVKGVFDGLRVIHDYRTGEDLISLVEFKTTVDFVSKTTVEMASFQLQLYIWMIKPYIEKRGLRLNRRHYVEIIRRADGKLLERFWVEEDPDIEEKIWTLVAEHDGIAKSPFKLI